ncbi:MAG: hypothetical protein AAF570_17140, partial [Bacteroidota bacterium]
APDGTRAFVDNLPEAAQMKQMQAAANASPQVSQLKAVHAAANSGAPVQMVKWNVNDSGEWELGQTLTRRQERDGLDKPPGFSPGSKKIGWSYETDTSEWTAPEEEDEVEAPSSATLTEVLSSGVQYNPMEQYNAAVQICSDFGFTFKGHKPHGSNDSTPRYGFAIVQNILDGLHPKSKEYGWITAAM